MCTKGRYDGVKVYLCAFPYASQWWDSLLVMWFPSIVPALRLIPGNVCFLTRLPLAASLTHISSA